jgi:hypothetical protein
LLSQLETDARLEECHVRQDEVSRLDRALTETVADRDSLQEWKEISQVREERGRKDMITTIQELRLTISKTTRTTSGVLETKGMSKEIVRLKNAYASLSMKYDRDVERLTLSLAEAVGGGVGVGGGGQDAGGTKEENGTGLDVVVLMSEKLTLENQLLEVRAIDASRKKAFDELEAKIVAVARQSTRMQQST